jgi:hypothetical protein
MQSLRMKSSEKNCQIFVIFNFRFWLVLDVLCSSMNRKGQTSEFIYFSYSFLNFIMDKEALWFMDLLADFFLHG